MGTWGMAALKVVGTLLSRPVVILMCYGPF